MSDTRIMEKTSAENSLENDRAHIHPLISWRSVLAGLLVTMLALVVLLSLGMAFGGIGLEDGSSASNAGIFTGVWFLISALISLFAGSYFAARVSKFQTSVIGSAQGLVIASLFFGSFLWQTLSAVGWAGRMTGQALGGAASAASSGVSQAAQNPMVTEVVEDSLGDLNIQPERVQTVVTGVASRLLRGNTEGAKTYLSRQTGITPAEADKRIVQLRSQVDQGLVTAREGAANALQATGWTLFLTLLFGVAASVGGGAMGSKANLRKPLTREQVYGSTGLTEASALR